MSEDEIVKSGNEAITGEVIPARVYLKRGATIRALDPEEEQQKIRELRGLGWKTISWQEGSAAFQEKRRITKKILEPIARAADILSQRSREVRHPKLKP